MKQIKKLNQANSKATMDLMTNVSYVPIIISFRSMKKNMLSVITFRVFKVSYEHSSPEQHHGAEEQIYASLNKLLRAVWVVSF